MTEVYSELRLKKRNTVPRFEGILNLRKFVYVYIYQIQ